MSDETSSRRRPSISRMLQIAAFGILLAMLVLSVIAQFTGEPPTPAERDQQSIEQTVQAGVDAGLTEIVSQTGTPDATAIQSTVQARIDATLTGVAVTSAPPTATPEPFEVATGAEPMDGVLNGLLGILMGAWQLAGFAGIWSQVCCCVVPIGVIVIGAAND
ncbi:MAG: hypothetical protein AAFV98_20010 [Chloroflexota bacterium]